MDLPIGLAVPQVVAFILVVARLSGLFLLAPVFSSQMIPPRIKIMVLLGLAATLTPIVEGNAASLPTDGIPLLMAVITESLVGLALGFSVSLVFSAVQVGASLIDTSIGFSMASIIDPLNNTQAAVLGSFYSMVATLSFLAVNGHYWMLAGFTRSFDTIRLGEQPDVDVMLGNTFGVFGQLFAMAFQIAAPVLITLLLADVVLGIVARVVPQMNVFFVGIPLKIGVGLLVVIISLPAFSGFFERRLDDIVSGASVLTGAGQHDDPSAGTSRADALDPGSADDEGDDGTKVQAAAAGGVSTTHG
jgi:flagellar biosynthetic protein FliR